MSKAATVPSRKGRPNHSLDFKRRLAQQACEAGVSVSRLAREHGINANMLFKWRRHYRQGLLDEPLTVTPLLPISIVPAPSPPPVAPAPVPASDPAGIEIVFEDCTIFARQGIDLDRSTMADWVAGSVALLRPLVEVIRRHVLTADQLHVDDTPVPVLAPGRGKTKTGRLWTYVRDDRPSGSMVPPAVWFAYSPDRKGIHPQTQLMHFTGILQADSYAGFNALFETGRITEAACWAHSRRKFYDMHDARPSSFTEEALFRIGELYAIEARIRGRPPDERRLVRQEQARPRLDSLHVWLQQVLATVSRKSEAAAAILYTLTLWPALTRYCDDGRIEIDNSAAERALRGVALGRRNYLFAGSDIDGASATAMYSLIGTAKINGVDPKSWLRHVLTHIAAHPVNRVDGFLAWHFTDPASSPDPLVR